MAVTADRSARTPLLDPSTRAALRSRVRELCGAGLVVLAAALGAALISYDITDPSPFSATDAPARNWLGPAGAAVADLMIRHVGLAAWALVAAFGVWGARFIAHRGAARLVRRLPYIVPVLALAPAFASTHGVHDGWQLAGTGLGGSLGDTMARGLVDLVPLADPQALVVVALALGATLLVLGAAALGVTRAEIGATAAWLARSLLISVRGVLRAVLRGGYRTLRSAIGRVRARRSRSATTPPAQPTGTWRARMPKIGFPGRSADAARDGRVEPRLDLDSPSDAGPRGNSLARADGALRRVFERLSACDDRAAGPDPMAGGPDARDPDGFPPPPDDEHRTPVERPRNPARRSRRAERESQPTLAFGGADGETPAYPPPLGLLQKPVPVVQTQTSDSSLEDNARMLETVLEDYGVRGEIVAVKPGPVVTLYELEPAPGLKASRVIGLADDIARSMSALAARVSTVPGRSIIGIELPNPTREKVWLRDVFERREYDEARFQLALALGKDISGAPVIANLARMPHLLIAGTTGSGKSVAINTMILSLLYRLTPDQCRLIMIDPKMLELSVYDNIPHLLAPVVTDPKKAIVALKWVVAEMEERYRKMSRMGVRNIDGYNARVRDAIAKGEDFSRTVQTGFDEATGEPVFETETFEPEELPYIVVIVDEMADLMMVAGKEIEACIQRLAQMARASGIHLIMATQRPSVDVITGTIKANFPTRISFQVTSKIDSRTILGEQGAEQLLGMGDMLFMEGGGRIQRVHGPFVSDEEVEEVVQHLKLQGTPDYVNAVTDGVDAEAGQLVDEKLGLAQPGDSEDALYDRAVAIVARDRKCSTSYIQRKLAIGYNKAARLVEQMEDQGVVTAANAIGKREILVEER